MSDYTHTLVATLGGQPQIVTFTLDLLLKDFPISEVFVVHPYPSDPRIQHALTCLQHEFAHHEYTFEGHTFPCRFTSIVLHLNTIPQKDIQDDMSASGTQDTIYHLIRELKQDRESIVHLSITGGRRIMGLLAMTAAQINFNHSDHIWHLYTPQEMKKDVNEGKLMHVSSTCGTRLIRVPFVPWGAYFPDLPQPPDATAQDILSRQIEHLDTQIDAGERAICETVLNDLTYRQRETLRAFTAGLTRKQVADTLHISVKTVDSHKTIIFEQCRIAWGLARDEPRDHTFLKEHFGPYFARNEYTPSKKKTHRKGGSDLSSEGF